MPTVVLTAQPPGQLIEIQPELLFNAITAAACSSWHLIGQAVSHDALLGATLQLMILLFLPPYSSSKAFSM